MRPVFYMLDFLKISTMGENLSEYRGTIL